VQTGAMATTLLFDRSGSSEVVDFASCARKISNRTVLWVDLPSPTDIELSMVRETFGLELDASALKSGERESQVRLHDDFVHVTVLLPPDEGAKSARNAHALDCYVGRNWLVTVSDGRQDIVEQFRELATGAGQIGSLDAMSFLATLLELVIVGYSEAFQGVEEALEEFDAKVLSSTDRDIESKVSELVRARRRVSLLRRTLAPHRRVFVTLSHTELDAVSTDVSGERFTQLSDHVGEALNGARDAREAVVNSFDMLILRTEHRTNEIVKVLTLTSILFLPGALIAGIMGMNINLTGGDFVSSDLFWGTLAVMAVIVLGTLAFARLRRWI